MGVTIYSFLKIIERRRLENMLSTFSFIKIQEENKKPKNK
jgi:hypothetical protein